MKKNLLVLALLPIGICVQAAEGNVSSSADYPQKNSAAAQIYRGAIVFQHYCVLCHGAKADGNGRAAKLYNPRPANLVMSERNDAYKELISRRGGTAVARSPFMPPWGNELTDEQVADVVAYLRSIRSPTVEVK